MPTPVPAFLAAAPAASAQSVSASGQPALDAGFAALQSYTHGSARATLLPIDEAVEASLRDAAIRPALEGRLAAVLKTSAPVQAREYVCRKLALFGSAASVPALAGLLNDKDLSDLAQSALESIPASEAGQALRQSLDTLTGTARVGVIQSLGERRDVPSVPLLAGLLADPDAQTSAAAAAALGRLGTPEAAQALLKAKARPSGMLGEIFANACLVCTERLLADGRKTEAAALLKALQASSQARHVQLAVQRLAAP